MDEFAIPLDELIAHRRPLQLLDRVISLSETEAVAELAVRSDNLFFLPGLGLPAYVGLEVMAQSIAAIDGMKQRNARNPPKIGFLLGCRRYSVGPKYFAEGTRLTARAKMVFTDGAMFSFECRIDDEDGAELAKANMNVYAPADPKAFLAQAHA
jgi:predicted hotdog family 3-hydroxylacyl-ACP dehydratase